MLQASRIFLSAALLLLAGCGLLFTPPTDPSDPGQQTVEPLLAQLAFQKANTPVRTLRIGLIADGKLSEDQLRSAMNDVSFELSRQVGITLEVTYEKTVYLSSAGPVTMIGELDMFHRGHSTYDIVIGVAIRTQEELDVCSPNCYSGMAPRDNMILLHSASSPVIIHEFGHLFLGWGHSPIGVMQSAAWPPFFSMSDRAKILENKWKRFGPPINNEAY